jgi:hypothetical protein
VSECIPTSCAWLHKRRNRGSTVHWLDGDLMSDIDLEFWWDSVESAGDMTMLELQYIASGARVLFRCVSHVLDDLGSPQKLASALAPAPTTCSHRFASRRRIFTLYFLSKSRNAIEITWIKNINWMVSPYLSLTVSRRAHLASNHT